MFVTLNSNFQALLADKEFLRDSAKWSKARQESSKRKLYQLANYNDVQRIRDNFIVSTTGHLSTLLWRDTNEEVVLDVSGIVAWCLLPPVVSKRGFTLYQGNPERTTQQIVLCGPEDENFRNALEAIKKIFQYHEEAFPPNTLNAYKHSSASHYPAIYSGTRILSTNDGRSLPNVDIPPDVDPENILRHLQSTTQYNYTDDNHVHFDQSIKNKQGASQRVHVSPAVFRQGHNVEISVVFKTMEKGKYRHFYIHLDSVLLQSRIGAQRLAEVSLGPNNLPAKRPNKRRGEEDDSLSVGISKKPRHTKDNDADLPMQINERTQREPIRGKYYGRNIQQTPNVKKASISEMFMATITQ